MDKARADNLPVQSLAIIKNSEHRNFVIGRFQTRARNGLSACAQSNPPQRHPFSNFFLGEGAATHTLSETDNPSSNCPSKKYEKKYQADCSFKIKTLSISI